MEDRLLLSALKFFCKNSLHFLVMMKGNRVVYANAKTRRYGEKERSIKAILPRLTNPALKSSIKKIKLPNRQWLIIRWHIFTLYSQNPRPLRLLIGEDISETESLRHRVETLSYIVTKVPGFVFWKDTELKLMGCNDNFARQVGLNHPNEIVGLTDHDLPWNSEQTEKFIRDDQEILQTGLPKTNIEEKQQQLDGKELFLLTSKVPLYDRDKISGVLGVYVDITNLKEAQHALQIERDKAETANRLKSEFILNMQHDIRTPISGIYGMTELLVKTKMPADIQSHLIEVTQSAKELLDYCNDILDFTYIEYGSRPLLNEPFSLKQLILSIKKMQIPAAQLKKINLSIHYDKLTPDIVLGDAYRIKRVLINLISNAIKFTPQGYVKVRVQIEKSNVNSQEKVILISVKDSGIGIPDEKMDFIYEKFSKVTPSNKGLYKGSGLGLRIVKQFIEEMNGNIVVRSELNKGTVFQIVLPLKIPLSKRILEGKKHAAKKNIIGRRFSSAAKNG
jgi:two-component system aerobic respiration control sensor histidine kinase ArcB